MPDSESGNIGSDHFIGADGSSCEKVDYDHKLATALGVNVEYAVQSQDGSGRCLVVYLSEGEDDGEANTRIIGEGTAAKTMDKGVVMEDGTMAVNFYTNDTTAAFPAEPVYARNAKVTPVAVGVIEGFEGEKPSNEFRMDRIEQEDGGPSLTQLHIFSGRSKVTIHNIENGEVTYEFEMDSGEQIRFDDAGNLVSMYSFNSKTHTISAFANNTPASCSVAPRPLSGRNRLDYPSGDVILPIVIVLSHRLTRKAIARCLEGLAPALTLLGYGAEQIGRVVTSIRDRLLAVKEDDSE